MSRRIVWWCDECELGAAFRSDLACPHADALPEYRLGPVDALVVERVDDEWKDEDAQRVIDFLGLEDTAENLDRIGMGVLDALASADRDGE